MTRPVRVAHPVLHRFVPRRGTKVQHGFGTGRTDVLIRGFEESPRLICTVGGTPVLAADGCAWETASPAAGAPPADEAELRRTLEAEGRYIQADRSVLADYLFRSPLCYSRVGRFNLARGASTGRGGEVKPEAVRVLVEDGSAQAAADVRGFLDERVRLHQGRVYLRYERVVLRHFELDGSLAARLARHPRADLGGGGAAHPSVPGSGIAEIEEHGRIPSELLRDDDATWFANAFAHRLSDRLGILSLPHGEAGVEGEARERFVALADELGDLERRAWTCSLTGDRLLPALRLVARALEILRDHHEARAFARPADGSEWDGDRMEAGRYEHSISVLRRGLLPRLVASQAVVPEDAESLAALAW